MRQSTVRGARLSGPLGLEVSAQRGEAYALCMDKLRPGQGAGMQEGEKLADLRRAAVAAATWRGTRHAGKTAAWACLPLDVVRWTNILLEPSHGGQAQ